MAKQNLLLVDADLRSLRVLEVSLRKTGYGVLTASDAREALELMEVCRPDLVLCDTRLPNMDGFAFIEELRTRPDLDMPLIVLSSDTSVESKVRGLELGVDDYLTKPIYVKELLVRVSVALQRKRREGMERGSQTSKQKFTGSLSDIGVVDLLQTIDNSKKSGVLELWSGGQHGAIYFRNGNPVSAELDGLRGARAIYRALVWTEGNFEIDFREHEQVDSIQTRTQGLLMEGMRRLDEWGRLLEQLPPLDSVLAISDEELYARLDEVPDTLNVVLRQIDGQRTLLQVVDACEEDDLETLTAIARLYFEGLLFDTGRRGANARPTDPAPAASSPPGPDLLTAVVMPRPPSAVPLEGVDYHSSTPLRVGSLPSDMLGAASDLPRKHKPKAQKKALPAPSTTRMVRVRRPHKRIKRLAWTRAPGLLSTGKRPQTDDAAAAHERAAAGDLSGVTSHSVSVSMPRTLILSESAWLDALQRPADSRMLAEASGAHSFAVAGAAAPRKVAGAGASAAPSLSARAPSHTTTLLRSQATMGSLPPSAALVSNDSGSNVSPIPSLSPSAVQPLPSSIPPASTGTSLAPPSGLTTSPPPGRRTLAAIGWAVAITLLAVAAMLLMPLRRNSGVDVYDDPQSAVPAPQPAVPAPQPAVHTGADAPKNTSGPEPKPAVPVVPPATATETGSAAPKPARTPAPAPNATTEAVRPVAPVAREPQASAKPSGQATSPTSTTAEEVLVRGQALVEEGKSKQARDLYESAVVQHPTSSALLSRLAFIYLNQGRNADAISFAGRAIQSDPTNSEGWIVLGAAKMAVGNPKGGREAFRQCAEQGRGPYVTECRRMLR